MRTVIFALHIAVRCRSCNLSWQDRTGIIVVRSSSVASNMMASDCLDRSKNIKRGIKSDGKHCPRQPTAWAEDCSLIIRPPVSFRTLPIRRKQLVGNRNSTRSTCGHVVCTCETWVAEHLASRLRRDTQNTVFRHTRMCNCSQVRTKNGAARFQPPMSLNDTN